MKIIDLTQTIESGMAVYDGDPEVKVEEIHRLDSHGWRLTQLSFGSHTGTHVDAPYHMSETGAKLDELPLEKFIGEAQMVSLDSNFPKHIGLAFREGELTQDLLPKFISANTSMVIVGDNAHLGVELERSLLQRGIMTFTNLINLSELPEETTFAFYGIPLKIKDGDGAPIRAFAIVN